METQKQKQQLVVHFENQKVNFETRKFVKSNSKIRETNSRNYKEIRGKQTTANGETNKRKNSKKLKESQH